jgi:hypothetical protein
MRELQRRRDAAEQNRDAAERAREAARRLAENMSDEERQRWLEQLRREAGDQRGPGAGTGPGGPLTGEQPASIYDNAPPRSDDMDLRGDEQSGERIAEWISDQPLDPDALRRGDPPSADSIRRAREAAERAVDESAVPPRYHRLIKKYFGKFKAQDTASGDAPANAGSDSSSSNDTQGDS